MIPLGPFTLTNMIGCGGMAEVWAGYHKQGLPVAVKILTHKNTRHPLFHTAFQKEVQAAARLNHKHIIRVFDYGQISAETQASSNLRLLKGSPYLVMELIEGGTLRSRRGRMRWGELKKCLLSLLSAIAHAHACGVLHRDLKPSNILLQRETEALVLTDFGLAHALTQEEEVSKHLMGTPSYMAPEQFHSAWRDYGPWTDLYALGCLAYTLASGKPPYPGPTLLAWKEQHCDAAIPALTYKFPVPETFKLWVYRLLSKEKSERFQSAADAAFVLSQITETDTRVEFVSRSQRAALPKSWRRKEPAASLVQLEGVGLGLYGLRTIPFVGRDSERSALWQALHQVQSEREVRVVLLKGPAGYGKSRMAEWLCKRAQEAGGVSVLHAVHSASSGPFDGIEAMLSRFLRCNSLEREGMASRCQKFLERFGVQDKEEALALTEFVAPVDATSKGSEAPLIRFHNAMERHTVLIRQLQRMSQERPVVLWLDDIHWSVETLEFVVTLLIHQRRLPVSALVLLTVQEEALSERPASQEVLRDILAHPKSQQIEVDALLPAERVSFVRDLLGLESALAAQVEEHTAGNPLFAVQLVGDWVARDLLEPGDKGFKLKEGARFQLPDDLHHAWVVRLEKALEGYTREQRSGLELAAVLGQDIDSAEWIEICQRSGCTAAFDLLETLGKARLIRFHSGGSISGWSFVHSMLRASIERQAQDAGRWSGYHKACAEFLRNSSGGPGGVERRGRHLWAAGLLDEAQEAFLECAEKYHERGDFRACLEILKLQEQVLEELRWPAAHPARARNWILEGWSLQHQGAYEEGLCITEKAESLARSEGWDDILALALLRKGNAERILARHQAAATLQEAERLFLQLGDLEKLGDVRVNLGFHAMTQGNFEEALEAAEKALDNYRSVEAYLSVSSSLSLMGNLFLHEGKFYRAQLLIEEAYQLYSQFGSRWGVASSLNSLGEAARMQRNWKEAERCYKRALERYQAIGSGSAIFPKFNLALILLMQDQFEQAQPLLSENLQVVEEQGRRKLATSIHFGLVVCAASRQDWKSWDAHFSAVQSSLKSGYFVDVDLPTLATKAGDVASRLRQKKRAESVYRLAYTQWKKLGREDECAELALLLQQLLHS